MRYAFVILIFSSLLAVGLGGYAVTHRAFQRPISYGGACEIRTFDYVTFLDAIREAEKATRTFLTRLKKDEQLYALRKAFLQSKLRSLEDLRILIEKQVETFGVKYSCVEVGYQLFMYDADYPTIRGLDHEHEIDNLWKKFEKAQQPTVTRVLEIVLGPIVALIVGILAFIKKGR